MGNSLNDELKDLLLVDANEVNGVLKVLDGPFEFSFVEKIPASFHYIRFQGYTIRANDFTKKICDHVISFCLRRERFKNTCQSDWQKIYLEAKNKIVQSEKSGEGVSRFIDSF